MSHFIITLEWAEGTTDDFLRAIAEEVPLTSSVALKKLNRIEYCLPVS